MELRYITSNCAMQQEVRPYLALGGAGGHEIAQMYKCDGTEANAELLRRVSFCVLEEKCIRILQGKDTQAHPHRQLL